MNKTQEQQNKMTLFGHVVIFLFPNMVKKLLVKATAQRKEHFDNLRKANRS